MLKNPLNSRKWSSGPSGKLRRLVFLLPLLFLALPLLLVLRSPSADVPDQPAVFFAAVPEGAVPLRTTHLYPEGTLLMFKGPDVNADVRVVDERLWLVSPPRVAFDGNSVLFAAAIQPGGRAQVWEVGSDGNGLRQVTEFAGDCSTPEYLPDGRIVFSGTLADSEGRESGGSSLFTCSLEGSPPVRISFGASVDLAWELLPDGRILFERILAGSGETQMLAIRPDGTEMELLLPKPAPGFGFGETFGDARKLEEPGIRSVVNTELAAVLKGRRPVDPVVAQPHPRPPVATSVVRPELNYGWLLCLDAGSSDLGLPQGSKPMRIRVLDGLRGETLGEGPIEPDGSFFLKVPADRLLLLETLDEEGEVLAGQTSGIWVRPNESRGCIGCHESRYLSPENRLPLAIAKPAVEIGQAGEGGIR